MHEQGILDHILRAVDVAGCAVRAVSLICDAQTLETRLAQDVLRGARTADVIERSLARLPLYEALHTQKIDTSRKSIQTVAEEIAAL